MTALALPGVDTLPPESLRQEALDQWFTPGHAAARLVSWCGRPPMGWRVLEPSAGNGALVREVARSLRQPRIDAIELDPRFAAQLEALGESFSLGDSLRVECCDYLTRPAPEAPYDLAVMNPPYAKGLDSEFLSKAMGESLRIVALVRLALLESQRSHSRIWSRIESGEWALQNIAIFSARPVFLAAGEESDGGKTAFAAVKLSRTYGEWAAGRCGTHVEWW